MISRTQFSHQHSLVDYLVNLLEQPEAGSWLEPEHIIVQSRDLGNWLTVEMAQRSSSHIAANLTFYQPVEFIDFWSGKLLYDTPDESLEWSKASMQWALYKLLPEFQRETEFPAMPSVDPEASRADLKWFRLAGHIADVFDKYMVYRPDWLYRWRRDPSFGSQDEISPGRMWQPVLWKYLCDSYPGVTDRAFRSAEAGKKMASSDRLHELPDRFFMVALNTLPEASVRWFEKLQGIQDVKLRVLELQFPLFNGRAADSSLSSYARRADIIRGQWGKQQREFFAMLDQSWPVDESREGTQGNRKKNASSSNLEKIQYLLEDPAAAPENLTPDPDEEPSTLQIHSTYGPVREVEVLYEKLLACFEEYEDLKPDDILIVTPDPETYTPHINAVFEEPGDEELRIPFHLADPGKETRIQLTELLIQFIEVARGRFKVTEVLDLLSHPSIRSTLELSLEDIDRIEEWLLELNVRWGYDARHRGESLKQSPSAAVDSVRTISEQNSWQHALDRLWMGLCVRTGEERSVHDRLPFPSVEGTEDTHRLGALNQLLHAIYELHEEFKETRTLSEWKIKLNALIEKWLTVEREKEPALQWLLEQVNSLDDFEKQTKEGEAIPVSYEIIHEMLQKNVLQQRHAVTRMAGRAVITSMVPVRNIPFKVVAMVGLNEDTFPGTEPSNPFDATQDDPRPGDRSRRMEDRQLMLDYLFSAQRQLIITYTGRDQRNDESIPPSPLVSELLDLLANGNGQRIEGWIASHPLHGFEALKRSNESYLASRVKQSRAAFAKQREEETQIAGLAHLDQPVEWESWQNDTSQFITVELDQLIRFYKHPVKYYCQQTMGIRLREEEQLDTDEEPFRLNALDRYGIYTSVLHSMLLEHGYEPDESKYHHMGILPHGIIGRETWTDIETEIEEQAGVIRSDIGEMEVYAPFSLDLEIEIEGRPVQVRGETCIHTGDLQLVTKTGGKAKPKDRLRTWIYHIVCNAADHEMDTGLWGRDEEKHSPSFERIEYFERMPPDKAREILKVLLRGMLIGKVQPLAFLPKSGYKWTQTVVDGGHTSADRDEALAKAAKAYFDKFAYHEHKNESSDPYYRYFFHDLNPYEYGTENSEKKEECRRETEKLISTAERIWKPMLEGRNDQ